MVGMGMRVVDSGRAQVVFTNESVKPLALSIANACRIYKNAFLTIVPNYIHAGANAVEYESFYVHCEI
jgi:hypothetical protein